MKRFKALRNPHNRTSYRIMDTLNPKQQLVLVPFGTKQENHKRAREIVKLLNLGNQRERHEEPS